MIGLTGGVGSGKSTVAGLLAEHGAMIVDSDSIAREVVEQGTPGYDALVARFGTGILTADKNLDRGALAAIVFSDKPARADLNAIIHPLVAERTGEIMRDAPLAATIVFEVPLLVEGGLAAAYDRVVVVEAEVAIRLARLAARGLPEQDARARMAAQATDEDRRAVADEVIINNRSREALAEEVRALWERLLARPHPAGGPGM